MYRCKNTEILRLSLGGTIQTSQFRSRFNLCIHSILCVYTLNVQRSLLKTIRKRQMEFLGHVCRRRGLEFLSLTGKVEGKRDRGKQRITFLDSLCNSATGGQSKGLNFLKLSDDRDVWRGMVANVCSRSGT